MSFNKMNLVFSKISASNIQISSDPEKRRKPRSPVQIFRFNIMFALFYSLVFAISFLIILLHTKNRYLEDLPESCPNDQKDLKNMYEVNFPFDFHTFLSENETNLDPESQLIWTKRSLTYGDVQSSFSFSTNISISEVG